METVKILLQASIALAILNVWLLRKNKPTPWRGGNATSLKKEFEIYGFPTSFMKSIGAFKLVLALLLIAGIWMPEITWFAATGLAITLLGAVIAHLKVHDPIKKSMPAASLMTLSTMLLVL